MANRYSSRVEQARYNLDQLEANKPGDYESQYKNQIDGVQSKLGRHGPGSDPQRRLRQQLGHQQRADRLPEHHERAGKRGGQPV